ncbi:hypothetical protein [Methylocapsa palsarum]|uniref:Uncharacterized protein n=1 Tax=Methylocapsa palsarum TaxID=1612308 RepID=A0A1I4AN09_9HYPH|nr:hypothetical protein SAMN05444581_1118 [Methylocapsa palsarum]
MNDLRLERDRTGLFTIRARISADAAMLMMLRMAPALCFAKTAKFRASLQDSAQGGSIREGLPCCNSPGYGANIGAIEIQADARPKVRNHVLTETSVGASRAGLCAIKAGFNASHQRTDVAGAGRRMSVNHCLYMHHNISSYVASLRF